MKNSPVVFDVNAVITHDGHPATTSLKVAEFFGKQHKNVIQSIESLDCSSNFNELNFQPFENEWKNSLGLTRKTKAYFMTKNGFMFLAMSFTGKKAAQTKENFIRRFDEMQEQLAVPALPEYEVKRIRREAIAERARIRRKACAAKRAETKRTTMEAYEAIERKEDLVTIKAMTKYLGISEQSIRTRIKKHTNLKHKNGIVYKVSSKQQISTSSFSQKTTSELKAKSLINVEVKEQIRIELRELIRTEVRNFFKELI